MDPQRFLRFSELPRELRDEIWRQCLPHRVVELDLPDVDWYLNDGPPEHRPCELWLTSWRNRNMPIITRVCKEARQIAFETGSLCTFPHPSTMSFIPDDRQFWVDKARDTLYLHWHKFLFEPVNQTGTGPLQLLVGLSSMMHTPSITADLLDSIERKDRRQIMRLLQNRPSWSVCGAFVWIHATDKAAILESGLWGLLGEESIALVDAHDFARIAAYRQFWQTYGTQEDVETKAFFEACVGDTPKIHYAETPEEYLQDLEVRWLHDSLPFGHANLEVATQLYREVWLTTPQSFDGREDDPRQADYGNLPGRPFARQLWSPKRDHPWVQEILSEMPEFRPTVMFRLCTGDCPTKAYHEDEFNDLIES